MSGILIEDLGIKLIFDFTFSTPIPIMEIIKKILDKLSAQNPVPKSPGRSRLKGKYNTNSNKNLVKLERVKKNTTITAIMPKITSKGRLRVIVFKEISDKNIKKIDKITYKK